MILLGIETSGSVASAAVCGKNGVTSQTSVLTQRAHSQIFLPVCKEVLKNAGLSLSDIDGFAVSVGPGSYTGLRIGIATVKAFCFALDKGCAGVSTLEALAYNLFGFKGYIRPVMKARQDLVYTALFESNGVSIKRLEDDGIRPLSETITQTRALDGDIIINGDGAEAFIENAGIESARLAPPHLRLQLASSLCYAAFAKGEGAFTEPDVLNAEYLSLTKPEKDMLKGKKV